MGYMLRVLIPHLPICSTKLVSPAAFDHVDQSMPQLFVVLVPLSLLQRKPEEGKHSRSEDPSAIVHRHIHRRALGRASRRRGARRSRGTGPRGAGGRGATSRRGSSGRSARRRRASGSAAGARGGRGSRAGAGRRRRRLRGGSRGGVQGAADEGEAAGLAAEVVGVGGDAVDFPLRADEGGDRLVIVGDVGLVAVGAGAGVGEGVL